MSPASTQGGVRIAESDLRGDLCADMHVCLRAPEMGPIFAALKQDRSGFPCGILDDGTLAASPAENFRIF